MTRDALLRSVLRTVAVIIAVAAVVDPVMTLSRPATRVIVVADLASSSVASSESAIREALPSAEITVRAAIGRRLPCAPGETCVMVADGSVDLDIPEDLRGPVSLIRLGVPAGPNLVVQSVIAARTQHGAASGTVRVAMTGSGLQGRRTELRVTDGAAIVGSAVHDWTQDGDRTVDVPWWPLGEGARVLRVAAAPFDGEASAIDNEVDLGVTVVSRTVDVLMLDTHPSWAGTFVRRALEDDTRFRVQHRAGLGPALEAGTAGGRLDVRTLDAVPVAIVGSPSGLSAGEVALLERFVGVRGGTLILLADGVPAGASARLFAGRWTEHLEASASTVGALRASETLRLTEASPLDVVLGSVKGSAAIVLSPTGNGRIVVSGAMDAWRYRDADGAAFDRFWRSLVFESAAGSTPVQLTLARPIVAPGTQLPFTVRHRQMDAASQRTVFATAVCGGGAAKALRLWPQGSVSLFAATVPIDAESCEVRVEVEGGPAAAASIAVIDGVTDSVASVIRKLERVATRTGGGLGDERAVAAALAATPRQDDVATAVHPMRSPWWMSPFVACLAVEWWLRRRAGLR